MLRAKSPTADVKKIGVNEIRQSPSWDAYERRKVAWQREHPAATYQEHEQAMRKLADECGV